MSKRKSFILQRVLSLTHDKTPCCVNTEWIPCNRCLFPRAQSIFRYCADTKLRAAQPRLYIIIVNNGYGQLNDRMHVGTRCMRQTQNRWVSIYGIECAVNPLTYTGNSYYPCVERIIQNNRSRCSIYNSSRIVDKLNNRTKNAISRDGWDKRNKISITYLLWNITLREFF